MSKSLADRAISEKEAVTFKASGAEIVTGTSTPFDTSEYDAVAAMIKVTAASGTPSMLLRLQTTYNNGVDWFDVAAVGVAITGTGKSVISSSPGYVFANAAAIYSFVADDGAMAAAAAPKGVPLGQQCRFQWTITGGTPSLTFSIEGFLYKI